MLHCAITFDEKLQNLSTLVISYKLIRGIIIFLIKYYKNLDLPKRFGFTKNIQYHAGQN